MAQFEDDGQAKPAAHDGTVRADMPGKVASIRSCRHALRQTRAGIITAPTSHSATCRQRKRMHRKSSSSFVRPDALPLTQGDILSECLCRELVTNAIEGLGELDMLPNNAGVRSAQASLPDISTEQFESTSTTRVCAMCRTTEVAVRGSLTCPPSTPAARPMSLSTKRLPKQPVQTSASRWPNKARPKASAPTQSQLALCHARFE